MSNVEECKQRQQTPNIEHRTSNAEGGRLGRATLNLENDVRSKI